MKYKYFILVLILLFVLPLTFLYADVGIDRVVPQSGTLVYNRFLVADLGLIGGGKSNEIFKISFYIDDTTEKYYLNIEVRDDKGNVLLSGNTDKKSYNDYFSGKSYSNHNITEATALGGSFSISDESKKLQDKILATGALPEGRFDIYLELRDSNNNPAGSPSSRIVHVLITPPYTQLLFPINTSVNPSALIFRWRSNLQNLKLHIFEDPQGRRELLSGSRLPKNVGGSSFNGSSIVSLLTFNKPYYWQLTGYMETSHGRELTKGPLSSFILVPEGSATSEYGISASEKNQIKQRLINLLKTKVNKKAANSIKKYDLQRILFDNTEISLQEIESILQMLENNKLKIKSVSFR